MKRKTGFLALVLLVCVCLTVGRDPLLRLYYRVDYESLILSEAKRNQISPHLIAAVIFSESRFRPDSKSDVGALGLMQLMPDTAREMAEKERVSSFVTESLYEPKTNIRLGSVYLAELLDRFSTEEEALAAYNAGPTVVLSWKDQNRGIVFDETRSYVKNVKAHKANLERLYPEWQKGP